MGKKKKDQLNIDDSMESSEENNEEMDSVDESDLEEVLVDGAIEAVAPNTDYLNDMDVLIAKANKEFQSSMKSIEDNIIITEDGDTPLISTGNPCFDVFIGGGIPQRRMTYIWGTSGTGKTTTAFQIGSSLFRNLYFQNKTKDWVYAFIDAEEGEARKFLDRIGLRLPYGKSIIPNTIEDIKSILENLSEKHKGKELFVIWDSIASTKPKTVTGRGDTARAVSALLRDIKFNDLRTTMITINQFREKTDPYSPAEPPGGNHPIHKSHLTLYCPSFSKSKLFTKNPRFARSVLFRTQKARDSFNDIDFRMEMTYHSGFDPIIHFITVLKSFGIYDKKNGPFKLKIDEEFELVWKVEKKIVDKKVYKLIDLIDHKFNPELQFNKLSDLYNFLLLPESYPYWNLGLRLLINQTFKQYFVQDNKFEVYTNNLHKFITDYYFSKEIFDRLIPTKLSF